LEKFLISDQKSRLKKSALSLSEAMTIVILFHQSGFRFFKSFYCKMIVPFWKSAFSQLVSYSRYIERMPRCLQALNSFFHQVKRKDTRISIIDSTKFVVCHNLRIQRHRVFKGLAGRGKSSTGWFYGFMVLWFYGFMVLWFYGFMVLWFYGFMVLCFYVFRVFFCYGFMVLCFYCFMVLWFYGFMVLWFYGFMVLWFYGFKFHLIINNLGEIINPKLRSGNVHDVAVLESLTQELKGVLLGDKAI